MQRVPKLESTRGLERLGELPISAASGLVLRSGYLYVVADDELTIAKIALSNLARAERIRLVAGSLPAERKAKKRVKPDFEALTMIDGQIVAWPSGSGANRHVAASLDATSGVVTHASVALVHEEVKRRLGAPLNIEGATVLGDELILLQRGNAKGGKNAVVTLRLNEVRRAFEKSVALTASAVVGVKVIALGALDDVSLGFTDVTTLRDGRLLFSAAAEATDDPYEDAPVAGSALGIMTDDFTVERLFRVDAVHKIEGVAVDPESPDGTCDEIYMVTDADDPAVSASLFKLRIAC